MRTDDDDDNEKKINDTERQLLKQSSDPTIKKEAKVFFENTEMLCIACPLWNSVQ